MENINSGDDLLSAIHRMIESDHTPSFRELVDQKKKELGINTDYEFSKMVGIANNTLARLIDGETQKIDLFSVLKVGQFLGIQFNKIAEVFVASLKPEFVGELDLAAKANFILKNFNLPSLKKIGFIKNTTDIKEIDRKITSFFGLESIYQYGKDIPAALFSRAKQRSKDEMRTMWIVAAVSQFQRINNPNPYDREALLALIPKIKYYTLNEESGYVMVLRALYKVGVTVIMQKYLSNTAVKGASFAINNKPCITVTDFKQKYSTIWFTLIHELYHILYDYEELKAWRYHLSGEANLSNDLFNEDMADSFARDRLLPKAKLDFIASRIDLPASVRKYSEQIQVHPSIIYDFYCYNERYYNNNNDVYSKYQHLFGNPEKAVKIVRTTPFDEDSVYEHLKEVETVYNF
ncbi:transporter (plasmid) [Hymenobacter tibetensis]|uniref:Transporter n=1 Tax=Hymenobacter tibetensis TaxID=497967 RepID=A0ABY4D8Z6_9BACT|nr:transporter [Hymenobacter tibetensis]UOG77696.1 transporter [Hymenobacter tibetensis]